MQSTDLILYAVIISIVAPVVIFTLTAYTQYSTLSMVKYKRRRTENIFKMVLLGGRELRTKPRSNSDVPNIRQLETNHGSKNEHIPLKVLDGHKATSKQATSSKVSDIRPDAYHKGSKFNLNRRTI